VHNLVIEVVAPLESPLSLSFRNKMGYIHALAPHRTRLKNPISQNLALY
jgi:hypothetical protein